MILLSEKKYLRRFVFISIILLFISWFCAEFWYIYSRNQNLTLVFSNVLYTSIKIIRELAYIICYLRFVEPHIITLLFLGFLAVIELREKKTTISNNNYALTHQDIVLVTIIGATLILLTISPLFWRDLRTSRFLLLLTPFIIYYIFSSFDKRVLSVFSIIFVISGLTYVSSMWISDEYVPPSVCTDKPVVYQNIWCYASQYLCCNVTESKEPYIADITHFDKYCKTCKMGTSDIPFENFKTFLLISKETHNFADNLKIKYRSANVDHDKGSSLNETDKSENIAFIPDGFNRVYEESNLSWLDKIMVEYLTPFGYIYYKITEYSY